MARAPFLAGMAVIALVVSGCSGTSAKGPDVPDASASAPPAAPNADTGSITGLVTDDESVPLRGAAVAIIEAGVQTQTDATGAFTFNALVPGTYRVVASGLGFRDAGRKADVKAGEVTEVRLLLEPIDAGKEAYVYTVPKTVLIHLGQRVTYGTTVSLVNNSAINAVFCDPCWAVIHHPATPAQVLTEPEWPGYAACPAINCDVWIYYKHKWTNVDYVLDGEFSVYRSFASREQYAWSPDETRTLKGKPQVMVAFHPAYFGSLEQKVTTYTSFAYDGEFSAEFTALPPAA